MTVRGGKSQAEYLANSRAGGCPKCSIGFTKSAQGRNGFSRVWVGGWWGYLGITITADQTLRKAIGRSSNRQQFIDLCFQGVALPVMLNQDDAVMVLGAM